VYFLNSTFRRDVTTQRLGAVLVWSANTNMVNNFEDVQTRRDIEEIYHADPIRYSAIHICLPQNNPFFKLIRWAVLWMVNQGRVRTVFHEGKYEENSPTERAR
jgi:hypothetical protein